MRIRPTLFAVVAALAAAMASSAAAADPPKCNLMKAAELPVTMRGTRPLVPAKLNGQEILFLADSGAFYSTLSPAAAARLKLPLSPTPVGFRLGGVGGTVRTSLATVAQMEIDGIPVKNAQFLVAEGADLGQDDTVGLLGQNLLGFADVEYDLANGVIRLIVAKGCEKALPVYWRTPGQAVSDVTIEPTTPAAPHLRSHAAINGKQIRVMFDTGASTSVLSLPAARKLGFRPDAEGVKAGGMSGGIGRRVLENWIAPFDSFEVGGETIRNTKLRVADVELNDVDMLLGADFFLSHRVYVSQRQHRLYFTYNGGPVFRLDREPPQQQAQGAPAAPPATVPPVSAGSDPTDVGGFVRRGLASMARRDFARAIADFDRAIALDPKQTDPYFHRATAHFAARQPVLAMADLDQVLKLKPDDTRALMLRGGQFLGRKDPGRAEADFDAAIKAGGPDADVRLTVGSLYAEAGRYEAAITQFDTWISEHPKDDRLTEALNGRCWTRALSGKDLDKALTDCDAALKRGGRLANVLDSRGLVKLRLGQLDGAIADYDAALKLQPRIAWSLYGRGLAKSRKGLAAAGEADMAAALALQPGLRARAQGLGLESAKAASGAAAPQAPAPSPG